MLIISIYKALRNLIAILVAIPGKTIKQSIKEQCQTPKQYTTAKLFELSTTTLVSY